MTNIIKLRAVNNLMMFVALLGLHTYLHSQTKPVNTALVHIRVVESESNAITPVMACIRSLTDNKVRIPPNAVIVDTVSSTKDFYEGIEYRDHKNWIGPVRKMNGIGNNEDRSFVYGELASIPHWEEPVAYQTSGDFTITLPVGTWQISMEHGNEYIPIKEEFQVKEGDKEITRTFQLERWIDMPQLGWYSGDIHVHHPTNRPAFRKFLLEYGKAVDIHLVNTLEMGHHIDATTAFKQEGFGDEFDLNEGDVWLVSGQEGPRSTYGHVIGLNINQFISDHTNYNYYDLVFKQLHDQPGAIVGYAHFSWNGCDLPRGFPWYVTTGEIDFVELLQFSKINTLDYYDYLNLGFRITAAAGSDIPWGSTLGEVRTFVYTGDNFNSTSWFEGFKNGHTFVSNGPIIFLEADGELPGSELIRSRGTVSNIRVEARSHEKIGNIESVRIYNSDGLLTERLNPEKDDAITIGLEHHLDRSQWLAAVVYCDNGAVAHTTPVYYIVDGKPTWNAQKAPEIIKKQLQLINIIEEEVKEGKTKDPGIIKRLKLAKRFYDHMGKEIKMD